MQSGAFKSIGAPLTAMTLPIFTAIFTVTSVPQTELRMPSTSSARSLPSAAIARADGSDGADGADSGC